MKSKSYERTILTLEVLKKSDIIEYISILRSPLRLSWILICQSFDNAGEGLMSFRDKLDSIKRMALGLSSAEKSAMVGDKLANYGLYQYAFHQFFQSSVRARQGHVLDKALTRALSDNGMITYPKNSHIQVLEKLGVKTSTSHDIDVFGSRENKFLIVQVRSRDDTGGTTAKGSLVELVRDISRTRRYPNKPLCYWIYIWEPLDRQQRTSLINSISESLRLKEKEKSVLSKGHALSYGSNIDLQVVYGPHELFNALKIFFSLRMDIKKYAQLIDMLGQWDDLWLSYSLATLELENMLTIGTSNFRILKELLEQENIKINKSDLSTYRKSSCDIAQKLMPVWKQNSIIFSAPSDQFNYIRDLVLLKMAHHAINCKKLEIKLQIE